MLKQLLKNISVRDITLMADVNKEWFINKSGKSFYYEINNFEMNYFSNFITGLSSNSLYTIIPIVSPSNDPTEPYLVLSRSILVSHYSDYRLIHHYLFDKYNHAIENFGMDEYDSEFKLIFKYKRISLDLDQLKKKFK